MQHPEPPTHPFRRLGPALVAVIFLCASASLAPSQEPAPATPAASPGVRQGTKVEGDPPDGLIGRWLAVALVAPQVEGAQKAPVLTAFEVTKRSGQLELFVRLTPLPEPLHGEAMKAQETHTPFEPTAEDLELLAAKWDESTPTRSMPLGAVNQILTPDHYFPGIANEPASAGSKVALYSKQQYVGGGVNSVVELWAVRDIAPDRLAGGFSMGTILAQHTVIPIAVSGDFTAYRVAGGDAAPASSGGFLDRLFSGCSSR